MRSASLVRLAVFAVVAFCAPAWAQTLYKLIDKNGKVTYSEEKPKQFDGQVIEMNIDPNANRAALPKYEASKTPPGGLTPAQVAEIQRANQKLFEARKALDEAKANPEMMRMGKAGGGARETTSPEYDARIAQLEKDVKDAQDEVSRAMKPVR